MVDRRVLLMFRLPSGVVAPNRLEEQSCLATVATHGQIYCRHVLSERFWRVHGVKISADKLELLLQLYLAPKQVGAYLADFFGIEKPASDSAPAVGEHIDSLRQQAESTDLTVQQDAQASGKTAAEGGESLDILSLMDELQQDPADAGYGGASQRSTMSLEEYQQCLDSLTKSFFACMFLAAHKKDVTNSAADAIAADDNSGEAAKETALSCLNKLVQWVTDQVESGRIQLGGSGGDAGAGDGDGDAGDGDAGDAGDGDGDGDGDPARRYDSFQGSASSWHVARPRSATSASDSSDATVVGKSLSRSHMGPPAASEEHVRRSRTEPDSDADASARLFGGIDFYPETAGYQADVEGNNGSGERDCASGFDTNDLTRQLAHISVEGTPLTEEDDRDSDEPSVAPRPEHGLGDETDSSVASAPHPAYRRTFFGRRAAYGSDADDDLTATEASGTELEADLDDDDTAATPNQFSSASGRTHVMTHEDDAEIEREWPSLTTSLGRTAGSSSSSTASSAPLSIARKRTLLSASTRSSMRPAPLRWRSVVMSDTSSSDSPPLARRVLSNTTGSGWRIRQAGPSSSSGQGSTESMLSTASSLGSAASTLSSTQSYTSSLSRQSLLSATSSAASIPGQCRLRGSIGEGHKIDSFVYEPHHTTFSRRHTPYTWHGTECTACGARVIVRKVSRRQADFFLIGMEVCPNHYDWLPDYKAFIAEALTDPRALDQLQPHIRTEELSSWLELDRGLDVGMDKCEHGNIYSESFICSNRNKCKRGTCSNRHVCKKTYRMAKPCGCIVEEDDKSRFVGQQGFFQS